MFPLEATVESPSQVLEGAPSFASFAKGGLLRSKGNESPLFLFSASLRLVLFPLLLLRSLFLGPWLRPQRPQKFLRRQGIDHILLLQPSPPRHHHPIPYKTQIPRIMRVRR